MFFVFILFSIFMLYWLPVYTLHIRTHRAESKRLISDTFFPCSSHFHKYTVIIFRHPATYYLCCILVFRSFIRYTFTKHFGCNNLAVSCCCCWCFLFIRIRAIFFSFYLVFVCLFPMNRSIRMRMPVSLWTRDEGRSQSTNNKKPRRENRTEIRSDIL